MLTREKYTGGLAIADFSKSNNLYLNNHHEGVISKEQYEALPLEMKRCSNVEIEEDGNMRRKSKKYSSKQSK